MAEGKSKKSSTIADNEISGRRDDRSSSPSSGYFSHVFSSDSSVMRRDTLKSDLYQALDKQWTGTSVKDAQSVVSVSGSRSQGNPAKRQPTYNKDGKPVYNNESMESTYFGSSVHYGGRDFYTSSSTMQATEIQKNYKNEEGSDHGNSAANRGEWWQGSLYY